MRNFRRSRLPKGVRNADDGIPNANICEQLVRRGADVNAIGNGFPTPLQLAVHYEDSSMTKLLLKNGADASDIRHGCERPESFWKRPMSSSLSMACGTTSCLCLGTTGRLASGERMCDKSSIVESLIAAGADVNHMPVQGDCAVIEACRTGCYRTVSLLLHQSPSLDHRSKRGLSPVEASCAKFWAASASTDISFLLNAYGYRIPEKGAIDGILPRSLVSQDREQFRGRALHLERSQNLFDAVAAEDYSLERVEALVAAEADVNYALPNGRKPLMEAALNGNFSAVLCLIENSADACATDSAGHSALSLAVGRSPYEIVQLLLNAGAKELMKGRLYEKAVELAKRGGSLSIIDLLETTARSVATV